MNGKSLELNLLNIIQNLYTKIISLKFNNKYMSQFCLNLYLAY